MGQHTSTNFGGKALNQALRLVDDVRIAGG